jgi:uncharacterized protein YceK
MHVSKILLAGAAASALLLSGCATTSQLEEVKGMAMKAQQTADMAMQKASAADQCCKANTEKLGTFLTSLLTELACLPSGRISVQ